MTMITPSYLGETIEYSSLHACRSTPSSPSKSKALTPEDRTLIKRFRDHRLAEVLEGRGPRSLGPGATLFLHLLPLDVLRGNEPDPHIRDLRARLRGARPMHASGSSSPTPSAEGYVVHDAIHKDGTCASYVQLSRDGTVEAVCSGILYGIPKSADSVPDQALRTKTIEIELVGALERYLPIQQALGVQLPILVLISVVGVKGLRIPGPGDYSPDPVATNVISIPPQNLGDYDVDPGRFLRDAFDRIWQSGGVDQSPSYGADGAWRHP